eukprot:XP_027320584.1 carboxypeptidase N subunit 2 [Anas platyrhynchos]
MGPSGHPTTAWMHRLEVVGLQQADTLSLVWDQCHRWQQGLGTATGHIQGRGPASLPGHTHGHQPVPCVRSPPVPWAGLFFEALQGHGLLLPISRKGQLRPSRNALSAASTSAPQNIFPFRRGSLLAVGSAVPMVVVPTMPLTRRVMVYVVLGLGSLLVGGLPPPCPPPCQCYDTSKVFCSEEKMREIPAGLPGNATQLFFVETALSSIGSGALGSSTTLTKLVFLNNHIEELEAGAFWGLPSLAELEISGNPLPAVSPGLLAGLPSLTTLSLSSNAIHSLQPGLFASACHLQDLRLRGNKIDELPPAIFHPLRHLQALDLSQNVLTELPDGLLAPLAALRVLKLSDNMLARLPPGAFGTLSRLGELHLDGNQLAELPAGAFAGLGALRRLQLQHNALGSLRPDAFAGLSNLTFLSLEGNQLASLPATLFQGTPGLLHLSLARNQLQALPPGIFANLSVAQSLVLSHNALARLPAEAFQGLVELTTLQLGHNNLSSLPPGLLDGLPSLATLGLEHNRLPRLPTGFFNANEELVRVGLEDNPWACDCRLAYLLGWLQVFSDPLLHVQAFCASPAALKGQPLLEVTHRQLACAKDEGRDAVPGEDAPGQCTYSNPEGTLHVSCNATSCQRLSLRLPPPPPGQAAGPGTEYRGAWVLRSSCGTLQVSVLVTAQGPDVTTPRGLPATP